MATANNTIKTRIQLKSDIEENWNKLAPKDGVAGFIPLSGELIIYSADNAHSFSRLKVGDGQTNVVNLPFIDAASLNGDEEIICKYNNFNNFPNLGSSKCLYLDLSSNQVYYYDAMQGYKPISIEIKTTTTTITDVVFWGPGRAATANIENNILSLENGIAPQLLTQNTSVITGVQIGGNNP